MAHGFRRRRVVCHAIEVDEPDVNKADGVDVGRSNLRGERLENVGDEPWRFGSRQSLVRTLHPYEEFCEAGLAKVAAVRNAGLQREQVPR